MDKAKLYKSLFACCDKEKNSIRPILKGINHELVGNQWVLGASNGHIAAMAYLPASELPEELNGKVRDEQGQDLGGRFPSIPSVMPKGAPFCKTEFPISELKTLVNALIKEPNGLPAKWKQVNRLILNGVCLNARFLQKALTVMELYGDKVTVEAHVKREATDERLAITKLRVSGTETYCLIWPAKPWDDSDARLIGIEGSKVDYNYSEACELVTKQKVKKPEKPKAWYE